MKQVIDIAGRRIGTGCPCFVIAEAGVNHNGSLATALRLVDVAALSRADAVKFQTFDPEALASDTASCADYQLRQGNWTSQLAMLRELRLAPADHFELVRHCEHRGILFLSTPFDESSADLLDALAVPAFKIGSGEITNHPLLTHVARKRKPILLSSGMSTLGEVEQALATIRGAGNDDVILLHCVSDYPAMPSGMNLRALETLRCAFGCPVGLSDHTVGWEVAVAAAALGASVIEKHFTLDRRAPGPDHAASLDPDGLRHLVEAIRLVESALGDGRKRPTAEERQTAAVARRSLVLTRDLPAGARLTGDALTAKRPGNGLSPQLLNSVIGLSLACDVKEGTVLLPNMLA